MTVTVPDVVEWANLKSTTPAADRSLQRCLDAVTVHFTNHYDNKPNDNSSDPDDWTADIDLAVIMQTFRLYKRRGSPEGVAGFDDLGIITITRFDPDIAKLLDDYMLPAIG